MILYIFKNIVLQFIFIFSALYAVKILCEVLGGTVQCVKMVWTYVQIVQSLN